MKLTLNVFENHRRDADKHWPNYIFGGRVRTSTLVLIVAFCATWWTYNTYKPQPPPPVAPSVIPPGYVPDPNYTWVPRTRVQTPFSDYGPTTTKPTPPTTTRPPTTTPPTTTNPPTTPPPPPPFRLPVLPPPFGPGTSTPAPTTPAPPGQVPGAPAASPSPAPAPLIPGLPG